MGDDYNFMSKLNNHTLNPSKKGGSNGWVNLKERQNITIIQCMRIACGRLTAVTREFKLDLEHRTFIIIASPDINVLKSLVLSFVFIKMHSQLSSGTFLLFAMSIIYFHTWCICLHVATAQARLHIWALASRLCDQKPMPHVLADLFHKTKLKYVRLHK